MIRNLRWYVAGLLMLATTVNYLDRQTLAVALPALRDSLGLTSAQYSTITSAFLIAYGLMLPISGRLLDWLGVRRGFLLFVCWWSAANIAHAFARGAWSLAACRFLLGMGEAGNFPGSVKAVSEWFPPKERATATGIFNLGAGAGAVIAPPLVAWLVLRFGWQAAFVVTGSVGFLWAIAWLLLYRSPESHPKLSPEELDHIRSGEEITPAPSLRAGTSRIAGSDKGQSGRGSDGGQDAHPQEGSRPRGTWREVLARREVWPIIVARMLTDPVWLFYLFWLPDYLNRARGFDLKAIGYFAWLPFLAADLGSLGGGLLSSRFAARGWATLRARKAAMCICASMMPLAIPAALADHWAVALAFISIATFGHQSWSASFITLPADLFPKRVVASAYGLTAMCGILAGAAFNRFVGGVVDEIGYTPLFVTVGFMHLIATAVLVWAVPSGPRLSATGAASRTS